MKLSEIKIKEILKFLVGGGSAVVVDFVVYSLLKQPMGLLYSKIISYIAGAIIGFIINKIWTFESKQFHMTEIVRYVMLYAFSALMNTLVNRIVLFIFTHVFFAFLCATGTSTIINFLGQKFFVFQKGKEA